MSILDREQEINYLHTYYEKEGSQIMVVYGKKGIGKTAILKQFAENKPFFYYRARSASEREQRHQFGMELSLAGEMVSAFPSYAEIFDVLFKKEEAKKIILIEEFQYIIKTDKSFMEELIRRLQMEENAPVMIVLSSSSVSFVENGLVTRIGRAAFSISGFLKIRELGIESFQQYFPDYSEEESRRLYAVYGGVPGLWQHIDQTKDAQENICSQILDRTGSLYGHGQKNVEEELRETAVYNTILAAIAAGNNKLNDLYLHTGFSRAKISVYLKNLMELELVEKVFEGKGVYRISDKMVRFYFTFLYPNSSYLDGMESRQYFDRFIGPYFETYVENEWEKVYS